MALVRQLTTAVLGRFQNTDISCPGSQSVKNLLIDSNSSRVETRHLIPSIMHFQPLQHFRYHKILGSHIFFYDLYDHQVVKTTSHHNDGINFVCRHLKLLKLQQ